MGESRNVLDLGPSELKILTRISTDISRKSGGNYSKIYRLILLQILMGLSHVVQVGHPIQIESLSYTHPSSTFLTISSMTSVISQAPRRPRSS